jgi:hypothetical protein
VVEGPVPGGMGLRFSLLLAALASVNGRKSSVGLESINVLLNRQLNKVVCLGVVSLTRPASWP